MEENEEWLSAGFTVKKYSEGFISYHLVGLLGTVYSIACNLKVAMIWCHMVIQPFNHTVWAIRYGP